MLRTPGFIRDSFTRKWGTRRFDAGIPLTFRHEAEQYLSRQHSVEYDRVKLEDVLETSKALQGYAGQRLIATIPCFALETPNWGAVARHVGTIAKSDGHSIILINCADEMREADFEDKVRWMEHEISRRCPVGTFTLLARMFPSGVSIGAVRKFLTDVAVCAALIHRVQDPVILSNDIDVCDTPGRYADIISEIFSDPCVDIATGDIFYGYSHLGDDYIGIHPRIPSLFLENRIVKARQSARLRGDFHGRPFFTTEGPHTAFRASAYCAANGYDSSLAQAEDDEVGIAIFAIRQKGKYPFPSERNARYVAEFCLTTNPRRQLLALLNGRSIIDTWSAFPLRARFGHEISLEETARAATDDYRFVQGCELAAILCKDPKNAPFWAKVVTSFTQGARGVSSSAEGLIRYFRDCGLFLAAEQREFQALHLAEHAVPTPAFIHAVRRFLEAQPSIDGRSSYHEELNRPL